MTAQAPPGATNAYGLALDSPGPAYAPRSASYAHPDRPNAAHGTVEPGVRPGPAAGKGARTAQDGPGATIALASGRDVETARRASPAPTERVCRRCPARYWSASAVSRYCWACHREVQRESRRRSERARRELDRAVSSGGDHRPEVIEALILRAMFTTRPTLAHKLWAQREQARLASMTARARVLGVDGHRRR